MNTRRYPRKPLSLWQIVYIPTLVAAITWALLS